MLDEVLALGLHGLVVILEYLLQEGHSVRQHRQVGVRPGNIMVEGWCRGVSGKVMSVTSVCFDMCSVASSVALTYR